MQVQSLERLTANDLKSNLRDIQGGLLEDYDTLACAYVFYTVGTPEGGHSWLKSLLDKVTSSAEARSNHAPEQTLNITISAFGLKALRLSEATWKSFPHAFREGMAARAHR